MLYLGKFQQADTISLLDDSVHLEFLQTTIPNERNSEKCNG
jgi:hypothetical protein